ncbi:MAG TPA: DUF6084 family protein [Pirellulales bacterium]|jgi:hypothetical protein|nr:DUF6084 family protein [Pirellulales bacterium]
MPDLNFQILSARADPAAAVPTLNFRLRIANLRPELPVQNIALRVQLQLEATRRHYSPAEQANLVELFGAPDQWSRTLGRLLWTHALANVGSFVEETTIELPIPCTFDFNVAATKYFHGLAGGDVPLTFLFSGTIFYRSAAGPLQIAQISWDLEAAYRMPVAVWQEMMDTFYPNSVWLRVRRDVFERLQQYKAAQVIPSWEQALTRLLDSSNREAPS